MFIISNDSRKLRLLDCDQNSWKTDYTSFHSFDNITTIPVPKIVKKNYWTLGMQSSFNFSMKTNLKIFPKFFFNIRKILDTSFSTPNSKLVFRSKGISKIFYLFLRFLEQFFSLSINREPIFYLRYPIFVSFYAMPPFL